MWLFCMDFLLIMYVLVFGLFLEIFVVIKKEVIFGFFRGRVVGGWGLCWSVV